MAFVNCNKNINKHAEACTSREDVLNLTQVYGSFVVMDEKGNDITNKCSFSEYSDGSVSVSTSINGETVSCTFHPTFIKYSPKDTNY